MDLPIDFIKRMENMLGDDFKAFNDAFLNNEESIGLRITKPSARELVENVLGDYEKIPWCENGYYADKSRLSGKHPYHISGLIYFQEPSATAPVSALPINPGDYVLDLCSAPGGKATQVAEKLMGKGLLVANEIIPKRAEILAENIERCGIRNAVVTNESPQRLSEKYPQFFDKIIVDAPCSGEGMFKKEPRAILEWSTAHTKTCALRQQHILDCAIKMLRSGGLLIYSTCTFSIEENEENVSYILSNYPDLSLCPIELDGLSSGFDIGGDMSYTKRIFPHLARGEGHFMALFKKEGELEERKEFDKFISPPKEFLDFSSEFLNAELKGKFFLNKEHLYCLFSDIDLDKIKTVRGGLYMGVLKKGRFEPSHALALSLNGEDFKNTLDFSPDDPALLKYLKGDVIPCSYTGWVAVLVDGFPIGWGKASGGILKNHFPKKYRLV